MRFIAAMLMLALLPGLAASCWHLFGLALKDASRSVTMATVGGLALDLLVLRKFQAFVTFEHELAHAVAAILCFRRVRRFTVTRASGGYVEHSGGFGGRLFDDFIGLAPYAFPTFSLLTVLLRPLVKPQWLPWYDLLVGLCVGYHVHRGPREAVRNWSKESFPSVAGTMVQSDIGQRGQLYSLIFIVTTTLALHGIVLAAFLDGYAGVPHWGYLVVQETCKFAAQAEDLFRQHVLPRSLELLREIPFWG